MVGILNVVLFQPEIPPNTGNIIRLCANSGAHLHMIKPFGFAWDDKRLRRAGLDYSEFAQVAHYDSYDDFVTKKHPDRIFACTTKGKKNYSDTSFQAGDYLLFGPETRGLPDDILMQYNPDQLIRIPMAPVSRSLNLSNAVAIILFEAWRQLEFTV